jgi:hypothetical protein
MAPAWLAGCCVPMDEDDLVDKGLIRAAMGAHLTGEHGD